VFHYFAGIKTVREEVTPQHQCPALLVQYGRLDGAPSAPPGWTAYWSGGRRGDDTERFVLYARTPQ
jgi:hypothetical protein